MAVHALDDGTFCISAYCTWMPGNYQSEKAARLAFRVYALDGQALFRLQHEANERNGGKGGTIRYGDVLKEFRRLRGKNERVDEK